MNIGQSSSNAPTDVVRRRYDRGAARYDLVTWPMERLAMDRFRARLIAQVNGPRVLEVGVGTGRNLPLYRSGLQIEAIDFSPRMLERARRKPVPANVTLSLMDIEELRFAPASFDTVVATCVFCSVPDPMRGLREIRRVLRIAQSSNRRAGQYLWRRRDTDPLGMSALSAAP